MRHSTPLPRAREAHVNPLHTSVLLLASGSSARMRAGGVEERKVWLDLEGKSVLRRALEAFVAVPEVIECVVVVHPDDQTRALAVVQGSRVPVQVVVGGAERMDSARAGLAALRSQSRLVAIHDAARPLVQPHTIEAVIRAAATHGAAIAARRVHDTIKRSPDGHSERETLDRALLWAAQTPQIFERARYTALAQQAAQANWTPTDDAALWERWEGPVQLVDGGAHNLKLTTPEDLLVARAICRARSQNNAET